MDYKEYKRPEPKLLSHEATFNGHQWLIRAKFEHFKTRPFDKAYLEKDGSFTFFLNHGDDYDVLHGSQEQELNAKYGSLFINAINQQENKND